MTYPFRSTDHERLAELLAARHLGLLEPGEQDELESLQTRLPEIDSNAPLRAATLLRSALHADPPPSRVVRSIQAGVPRSSALPTARRLATWFPWAIAALLLLATLIVGSFIASMQGRLGRIQDRSDTLQRALRLEPEATARLLSNASDLQSAALLQAGDEADFGRARWSSSNNRGILSLKLVEPSDPATERYRAWLVAADGTRVLAATFDYTPQFPFGKLAESDFVLAPASILVQAVAIELSLDPLLAALEPINLVARADLLR